MTCDGDVILVATLGQDEQLGSLKMKKLRKAVVVLSALLTAFSNLQAATTSCPVGLSPFAEATIDLLEERFCEEAQAGWQHLNLPTSDAVQQEKDTIFMLLAFALVSVEWDPGRGHQIAAVIVDELTDEILWVDFNSNFINNSPIDHAEARAVRNYIQFVNDQGTSDQYWEILDDTAVYASLEPCQMCAGTINMARVDRVVFGMEDDGFGDALDYLHAFPYHVDFEFHSSTQTAQALIGEVAANPNTGVTTIIRNAKLMFDFAVTDLQSFMVAFPGNQNALDNALATLAQYQTGPPPVPDGTFGVPLLAQPMAADASRINVTWDTASCVAADYHILYGTLSAVPELAVEGSVCQLGPSGSYLWQDVPAGPLWFLVVSEEDDGTEGSWGTNSTQGERNGSVPSGMCGMIDRDNTVTCP
jgi:tRNA(Arg) A34 adenosine deaminase TadA